MNSFSLIVLWVWFNWILSLGSHEIRREFGWDHPPLRLREERTQFLVRIQFIVVEALRISVKFSWRPPSSPGDHRQFLDTWVLHQTTDGMTGQCFKPARENIHKRVPQSPIYNHRDVESCTSDGICCMLSQVTSHLMLPSAMLDMAGNTRRWR